MTGTAKTAHYQALADLDDETFVAACVLVLRNEKFMPKPATIREYATQVVRDRRAAQPMIALPQAVPTRAEVIDWLTVARHDVRQPQEVQDRKRIWEKRYIRLMPESVVAERDAAYATARKEMADER